VADDEVAAVDEVSTEDPGGRSTLPAWDRAAPLEPTTSGGKGIGTEDGFANILNTGSDVDGSIVQARKSISGSVPGSFAPTWSEGCSAPELGKNRWSWGDKINQFAAGVAPDETNTGACCREELGGIHISVSFMVLPPIIMGSMRDEGKRDISERSRAPAFGCNLENGKTDSSKTTSLEM
jgi:hypothetical protein